LKLLPFILLALAAASAVADERKAIFIIVDGIPADVIEQVSTPNLDAIAGAHGYTRSYVGGAIGEVSESPTVSSVGYNSILTGTWSNKHNVWDNQISDPNYNYWDIFRIAKNHDAALQTAVFSTWTDNRTKLLGDGLPAAGSSKIDHHVDGFELDTERFPHDLMSDYIRKIDALVAEKAAEYVASQGPDLTWVYLQYTDDVAHRYGDGSEMTAAVRFMDDQLGRIWAAVRQRQQDKDESWMVLVTTDHGRDAATGRKHGGQTERERTTWIVTNVTSLNARFEKSPAVVDILPSIAAYMRLDIPAAIRQQLDGQSFVD
jgi:predicted AlkP superfamily pyrophosphatase or phosphodiesterase